MKTKLLLVTFIFSFIVLMQAQERTYMPDDVFEAHMIRLGYDDVLDNYIPTSSAESIKILNLGGGIEDPTGIESFTAIENLDLGGNKIKSIDLTKNTKLRYLDLSGNEITELNVATLFDLEELLAPGNQIETINVSNNTILKELNLTGNKLKTIDVSSNLFLEILDLSRNEFTELDISVNINMIRLFLDNNLFTSLDLSDNTKLTQIELQDNQLHALNLSNIDYTKLFAPNITGNPDLYCVTVSDVAIAFTEFLDYQHKDLQTGFSLDCSKTTNIPDPVFEQALIDLGYDSGTIDGKIFTGNVSAVTSLVLFDKNISNLSGIGAFYNLEVVSLKNNNINSLDVSQLSNLKYFYLKQNPTTTIVFNNSQLDYIEIEDTDFTSLDLSKSAVLRAVKIEKNSALTSIDFGTISSLKELELNNNKLQSLNLVNGQLLEEIQLDNNQLISLNITSCTSLIELSVENNLLTDIDLTQSTNIEELNISDNKLEFLNLYSNTKLESLYCSNNELVALDFRENTVLDYLEAENNKLTSLVTKNGNNESPYSLSIVGNPNLTCVEVDNVTWSENNWSDIDDTASFSTDCPPANDDCVSAIPLIIGQETPGDINNGTFTNATDCVAGTIIADVWYSIIIPETGEFSIEGAGFGGLLKFAVYESCTSSSAVSCGVNISLTNLNPGDVYYLKVWMEEASTSNKSSTSEAGAFTLTANESSVLFADDFIRENIDLVVFPNPAKSNISVLLSNSANLQKIEIYSILGDKIISQKNRNQTKTTIDISHLSPGIYFIRAKVDDKIMTKKLIIR